MQKQPIVKIQVLLFVLGCLTLLACNSGGGDVTKGDAGPSLASDARLPADAAGGSDVAPRADSATVVASDSAAQPDVTPIADQAGQAGQADASTQADAVVRNDASPGSDTVMKNDGNVGNDTVVKAETAPSADAVATPDTGPDSIVPQADSSVRADGSDGSRTADTFLADLAIPTTDAVASDPKNTLYVAVDGSDADSGTKDKPVATIKKAASLAQPGTLIYLRAGTYKLSATVTVSSPAGTSQDPIRLWAYPGEAVVLDFAGAASISKGLSIDASYWHVKGLVVQNSAGRGLQVSTGTGIVIENCETRNNGDMGLVVSNGASNALIVNCDSHHNFDEANAGENADGFGAKSNVGTGVIFRNCRAWANSDDGWDLYGAPSAVRFEHCWAYKNGENFKNISGFGGDGNGFKLGKSDGDQAHHVLVNCLAWDNLGGNGYEDNNNTGGLTFFNSVAYKNKKAGFEAINNTNHILKNNLAYQNISADNILTGSVVSNNSWNGFTVTDADFLSLDDTVAVGPRKADGGLPASDFLHLRPTSGLIDKGVDVGLPFVGAAPDLGAYEAK